MKHSIVLTMALMTALALPGEAATKRVDASVTRTLVADQERWGGCMAKLDRNLADFGLDCPGSWVTFSCSGTFTTKDIAYRMFDSAQMAFALQKPVYIWVDDTKKHNAACYAPRIDVLQ